MRKMDRSVWTAALVMMLALALMLPAMAMAETSANFWNSAVSGVITLTEDVTIDDEFNYLGTSDITVDLKGHTLKLTQQHNHIPNNNGVNVEIKNGTIDIGGITAGQGIILIGQDSSSNAAHLKLNNVTVNAKDVSSGAGTIHLYGASKFDMIDSTLNVTNESSSSAYAIYCNDPQGIVNIKHSQVNVNNGNSGIYYGLVTISDDSTLDLKVKDNGINAYGSAPEGTIRKFVVENSSISTSGGSGRGLTLNSYCIVEFNNGAKLVSSNFGEGSLMYKSGTTAPAGKKPLTVDTSSEVELVGTKKFVNAGAAVSVEDYSQLIDFGANNPTPVKDKDGNIIICRHVKQRVENEKAGSCAEAGYSGDLVCDVCGLTMQKGSVIPPSGNHKYQWVVDKEAAAGVAGQKHEECTVCGDKKAAVEIPALPVPALPQTGDTSNIAVYALVLAASMMGILALLRKKESRGA